MNKGISIIGISAVLKGSEDIREYWTDALEGKCGESGIEEGMPEKQTEQWALQAAKQALFGANLYGKDAVPFIREKAGVILAVPPKEAGLSQQVAEELGLHGTCYSLDIAGAGSLAAIRYAVSEIASGNCKMVLTGGLNLIKTECTGKCGTENRTANGMGMLLLKRSEEADRPYGYVRLSEKAEGSIMIEDADSNYMDIILKLIMGLYHKMTPCFMSDYEANAQFKPWIVNRKNPIRRAAIRFPNSAMYLVLEEVRNEHKGAYRIHKFYDMVVSSAKNK